jgi:predicted enzyme related to lactoylglutathione lyase
MTVRITCVAFDCADALTVGRFWSKAVGRPLDDGADSGFASIGFTARRDRDGWGQVEPADEPTWLFAQVPEPKAGKNRLHLDVVAPDVEAEITRLVGLGATRVADREEYGYTWTLMADPEGNEFDIARQL